MSAFATFKMADSGPWSLGTLIWLPIAALLVVAFASLARWLRRQAVAQADVHYGWDAEAKWFRRGALLMVALLVVFTALGMYPYKAEYHQWRDVSGTVEKIDKRLISDGDNGMSDKFVIRFADSDGAQFACDDTRCASVQAGDLLKLSCKRAWQYTGTDGYDCRFVSTEAQR